VRLFLPPFFSFSRKDAITQSLPSLLLSQFYIMSNTNEEVVYELYAPEDEDLSSFSLSFFEASLKVEKVSAPTGKLHEVVKVRDNIVCRNKDNKGEIYFIIPLAALNIVPNFDVSRVTKVDGRAHVPYPSEVEVEEKGEEEITVSDEETHIKLGSKKFSDFWVLINLRD